MNVLQLTVDWCIALFSNKQEDKHVTRVDEAAGQVKCWILPTSLFMYSVTSASNDDSGFCAFS